MTDRRKWSWLGMLVTACSAVAFFLLITYPVKSELTTNTPLVILLLLAGMRYGSKETWIEVIENKKYRLLLVAYGIVICRSFYQIWISSSQVAGIAERLHLPHGILVLLTAVGLMVVSIPFVLQTLGMVLKFAKGKEQPCDQVQHKGCSGKKVQCVCFLVAAGTIAVCSKSSFLYPINDWVDVNCFLTVGKSMMNGVVPYRDLFEQKGPFLYFLHGLAWLISNDSFLGVYFLEVIAAAFFLYYAYKSACLFISEKMAFLMIPVAAVVIYTSPAFCHGDSVEELCMPVLAYAAWVGFKAMVADSDISNREYLIIGICSGLVFWSKFILVGFYIGWFVVPALLLLKKKAYRKLFTAVGLVATGVLLSTIPFIIYFGINNAIGDWLEVYLYDNLLLYSKLDGESVGLLDNLKMGRKELIYENRVAYVLCIFGMLWFCLKKKDSPWKNLFSTVFLTYLFSSMASELYLFAFIYLLRKKIGKTASYMISMEFFTFFFTYMSGRFYAYYAFVFSIFIPFGVIAVMDMLCEAVPGLKKQLERKTVPVLCVALSLATSFWMTPNRYLMGTDRMELPQYQFARIIHQVKSPTLLNYGFLDGGFYTAAELIPNCKAFCKLNIPLEELIQLQEKYVREGLCDFVVTRGKKLEYEHYTLVAESSFILEENMQNYYLYQLK